MFIASRFTAAGIWNKPLFQTKNEYIKKMWNANQKAMSRKSKNKMWNTKTM